VRTQRRINHTNRQRILREMVDISIKEDGAGPPSLSAELNLSSLSVPANAEIYVEAYHKATTQRFSWGSVANPQAPESTVLDQIDLGGRLLFRVKVVDNSGDIGLILASADQIPGTDEDSGQQRDHLIVVIARDLGEVPWDLSIASDGDTRPALILNSRMPDIVSKIQYDPVYQSLLLPAVVREVYTSIFWDNDGGTPEDSWQQSWLDFGEQLVGQPAPDAADAFACREWLDHLLGAFSGQHKLSSRVVLAETGGTD
jgi:hypothetical protein